MRTALNVAVSSGGSRGETCPDSFSRTTPALMSTAPTLKGEGAASTNAWNFSACVGSSTEGASGSVLHVRISSCCNSGEFGPLHCNPGSKSAEERSLCPSAPQAASRKKETTRIGAIRFTMARSCKLTLALRVTLVWARVLTLAIPIRRTPRPVGEPSLESRAYTCLVRAGLREGR